MICRVKRLFIIAVLLVSVLSVWAANPTRTGNKDFNNITLLNSVFEKLYQLEKNKKGKINIVHIGDSHVQADFFTNSIRQTLQSRFGNGGYGFTFPYKLAKTNGTSFIRYSSDIVWESRRNIYPVTDVSIGLSGIGLYTNNSDFSIEINTSPEYSFNTIKVLYPTKDPLFEVSTTGGNILEISQVEKEKLMQKTVSVPKSSQLKYKKHKVQARETLYRLSNVYKVSVDEIKKVNNLTSNTIKVGSEILIPIQDIVKESNKNKDIIVSKTETDSVKTQFSPVLPKNSAVEVKPYYTTFSLSELSNQIILEPDEKHTAYNLSGIVIENDKPGVVYHAIGVNGTKVSDYNKYPLFFEQLPILEPDLLIISLGTNEAFGKWTTAYYMSQMRTFINKVKAKNPNVVILLMTPPPSLFKRKQPNTFVADYSEALKGVKDCVVWDLLSKLGGAGAPQSLSLSPLMARDKVHYTKAGYEMQGEYFSTDFLSAYDNYIKSKANWKQH